MSLRQQLRERIHLALPTSDPVYIACRDGFMPIHVAPAVQLLFRRELTHYVDGLADETYMDVPLPMVHADFDSGAGEVAAALAGRRVAQMVEQITVKGWSTGKVAAYGIASERNFGSHHATVRDAMLSLQEKYADGPYALLYNTVEHPGPAEQHGLVVDPVRCYELPEGDGALFQVLPTAVRLIVGLRLAVIPWDDEGLYKAVYIAAPQVRGTIARVKL